MNKKIALALLLSTLYVGTVHVADRRHVQPGAFPSPSYANLMGWAPEISVEQTQPQETQPGQPNDHQGESQQWQEYRRRVDEYNAWVMSYNRYQQQYRAHSVTAQPSAQPTHTTDSHAQRNTLNVNCNCCVIGDKCCAAAASGNDECSCDCPLSVTINPLVRAALNLLTCGAADADEDPSTQQLHELQERNPGMRPVTATLLPAGKPRVVTIEHQPKAHKE